MLQKGLTRAGVRDADHQTLIANAVSDLEYWTPEESGKTADVFFFGNAQPRLKSKPDNIQVLWIEAGSLDQMPFKQHGMD
jgi:hypothetical protein